jgi:LPPG:FO 2-phospho-L-lactate transferase
METLAALGGETWFRLGDRDLAVHVMRTQALARGESLSQITATLAASLGVKHAILPMSDQAVRTIVATHEGELPFQQYFVRRRCEPVVKGFRFDGAETAAAAPTLRALFESDVEAVVVCPSNPFVSIAPLLAIGEIREWLERRRFPVVAVSPIVGGDAVKGPAAKMMRELGLRVSASAVAAHYGALVDGWVVDSRDAAEARAIESAGRSSLVTDTLMTDASKSAALAKVVIDFASKQRARAS